MPIQNPAIPPSVISHQPNGAVDVSLLERVDEKTGYIWLMASLPARGMRAMHAAIKAQFGVQMTSVGRGRTFQTQKDIFEFRHNCVTQNTYQTTPSIVGTSNKKIWPAALQYGHPYIYFVLKPGFASAAVPGTSFHGMWCADDMALPDGPDADLSPDSIGYRQDILGWMYTHEREYGFAHSLTSEPWHVQWIAGDTVPPAVAAYELGQTPIKTPVVVVTPPIVNPPLPKGALMYTLVKVSTYGAMFLGIMDQNGIIGSMEWIGPGDDSYQGRKVQARLKAYAAHTPPVPTTTVGLDACLNITLTGAMPFGDSLDWNENHFGSWIARS